MKDHGFSDEDARYVVEWIGGVPWMIEEEIDSDDPRYTVEELYKQTEARLKGFLINCENEEKVKAVMKEIIEGNFELSKENVGIVIELVDAETRRRCTKRL